MPLRPGDLTFLPELERVRAAGVNVLSLNVGFGANATHQLVMSMITTFREWLEARPHLFTLVATLDDAKRAQETETLGVCFDIEGMDCLEGNPENVLGLYDRGVRWMLASYNRTNAAGGGCLSEDRGLTALGRRVVQRMNEVGMVVCASHCGYRTARDLIDVSETPVIFSHSNPRAIWDHPRNIPDDLIKACAARGGVIGINGFGPFLGRNDARTSTYVRHVEYVVDLVGEDHVGIGLDYVFDSEELDAYIRQDQITFPPAHYQQGAQMVAPWQLAEIAEVLMGLGRSRLAVRKFLGGNFMRIAWNVWR